MAIPVTKILRNQVLYNESVPTELADKLASTAPLVVGRLTSQAILHPMAQNDPERFDALEKAGFKTERYGDIIFQICERFGGHYMDVGASAKISKGAASQKKPLFQAIPLRKRFSLIT